MTPNDPIAALEIDYRYEVSPQFTVVFSAVAILAIVLGALRCIVAPFQWLPYVIGPAHLPSYYPSAPVELCLNLIPLAMNIFAITAGILALRSGSSIRALAIWAWCEIVSSTGGSGFDIAFELTHIQARYQNSPRYYLVSSLLRIFYYWAESLILPIMVIVLQRINYAQGARTASSQR